MKRNYIAWVVATLSLSLIAEAQSYKVDAAKSSVKWSGSKVVGGGHDGTLNIKSGVIEYKDGNPVSAEVIVDMTSIKNTDLTDKEWNKKLVDHLKSDDFFSVEKHKDATLKINKFKKVKDLEYELSGDLTIKGITKPVSLKAKASGSKTSLNKIEADLEFDRTDFEVRYGSGKFFENLGDKMIADKVKTSVVLVLSNEIKLGMK